MSRLLLAGLAAVILAAGCSSGGDETSAEPTTGSGPVETADPEGGLASCAALEDREEARACYAEAFSALMRDADDPGPALEEIAVAAYSDPSGRLLGDCHGVGRAYATEHGVTLASLMDYLPQTNEPGCSAGFAHGLVTAVAPEIDLTDPQASAGVCDEAETRYRRYSCIHGFGHAFMRLVGEDLEEALAFCSALGPRRPRLLAGRLPRLLVRRRGGRRRARAETVITDPRELCGAQADEFVRPCWYRAFVENRPAEPIGSGADLLALCEGLTGLQRDACITAASVVGPPDSRVQLSLCAELDGDEAVSCIHGTKVQNLIASPPEDLVALVRQCDGFPGATRLECYRWLGKVSAVLTDGAFEEFGCGAVPEPRSRGACVRGARAMDEPLVTFS